MLAEIGLTLPSHPPLLLTEGMMRSADVVVTMGCLDSQSCPARLKSMPLRDWALTDPAALDDLGFRRVRDEIRAHVTALQQELARGERRQVIPPAGR